ncbi:hypothetical protein L248_0807 [Schleiferilactobacillus shenzhenensis LY-73]|uniref:Uncharacterized protein n=1 Tax=Schleiferilactobacillus shenzhenensis LY-73 TaxID=1231336 RepID=U4TRU5_9LACO|nr:hypothetical protein L248_0807 [Schleiferilactobacillus shenzhenensis LY-73]
MGSSNRHGNDSLSEMINTTYGILPGSQYQDVVCYKFTHPAVHWEDS